MIFVTVGYHTPFKRLLDTMDAIAPMTGHSVIMQMGAHAVAPKHCEGFAFSNDLSRYFDEADLIVTQGGYTVLELIKRRKQFIVFPRLAKFGEVINDHQLEFSTKMKSLVNLDYPVLTDENLLLPAITSFRPFSYGAMRETLPALSGYLHDWLENVRRGG